MSGLTPSVIVEIPGSLTATYADGEIIGWTFMPAESYAGYFGPPTHAVTDTDVLDHDPDVNNTDGRFWRAVQEQLTERVVDDDDSPYRRTMFSVSWEE